MLNPTTDRVLVRVIEIESKDSGGISDLTTTDPSIIHGVVVAVGVDVLPEIVEVGYTVIFQRDSALVVDHGGESFSILQEKAILATVTNYRGPSKEEPR